MTIHKVNNVPEVLHSTHIIIIYSTPVTIDSETNICFLKYTLGLITILHSIINRTGNIWRRIITYKRQVWIENAGKFPSFSNKIYKFLFPNQIY